MAIAGRVIQNRAYCTRMGLCGELQWTPGEDFRRWTVYRPQPRINGAGPETDRPRKSPIPVTYRVLCRQQGSKAAGPGSADICETVRHSREDGAPTCNTAWTRPPPSEIRVFLLSLSKDYIRPCVLLSNWGSSARLYPNLEGNSRIPPE